MRTHGAARTRGVLVTGLLVALAVLGGQASGASPGTVTIHLTADGPKPAQVTSHPGVKAVFVNDDNAAHQVTSQGGWQYDSGPIPPGQSSPATPAFGAPGTYRYSDVRGIVVLPQTFAGSIVVKPAPAPTGPPAPSRSPHPRPTSGPTARPTSPPASPDALPTAVPTSSASPTPRPTPVGLPSPRTSSPAPTPVPTPRYGGPRALVQGSPHRYGLPALIGLVGIGGVLSLLARFLLSLPEGRRRRE